LRKGSISSQVQKTLIGLKTTGEEAETLTKQKKLIIAEIYRMFPQSEDWADNCDKQSARAFAIEAIQAVKEDPSDPTMVLSWNMIDEWMAEGNAEMISLLTEKFTPEEYNSIKRHTELGYIIMKSCNKYQGYAETIYHHHEKYDGSGYPGGLKGNNIPFTSLVKQ
jgi:hypothetical protein